MDCIVRKNTPYRRAEFERRQRITIEDFSTWIASKEDLIIFKLISFRARCARVCRRRANRCGQSIGVRFHWEGEENQTRYARLFPSPPVPGFTVAARSSWL